MENDQQPNNPHGQQVQKNKHIFLFWIIIIVIGVFVYKYFTDEPKKLEYHKIQITADGDCEAWITYINETGGTEMINRTPLPWSKSYNCYGDCFIYISAQAQTYRCSIIVKIFIDGKEAKSSNSHGDFVIASADYSLRD